MGGLNPISALAAELNGEQIILADRVGAREVIIEPEDGGYVWIGDRRKLS